MFSLILVGRLSRMRADLVPDGLWERVAPLLPPAPERRRRYPGRLRVPGRTALVGVNGVTLCGLRVFVDEAAESIVSKDASVVGGGRRSGLGRGDASNRSTRQVAAGAQS
ncbi:hypothetical protein GCM10010246_77510 [Streptomyces cuspidosporus]|uniref:Transposase n=1 Tax=Streptomyces cuspidosporus TaxID=66882 RepID=A0ABP5U7G4_9ACTN